MIAVIGEMGISFRPCEDLWSKGFSGLGYDWVVKLRNEGLDTLLLTVLPFGKSGEEISEELVRLKAVFDPDMMEHMNPLVEINGEWLMKSSSVTAMSTEKLTSAFSYFSDIKSVVISSALLSYNPSSSAILDAVSFMFPQPKVAIDTGCSESAVGNKDMLERTLSMFSSACPNVLITDDKERILDFIR